MNNGISTSSLSQYVEGTARTWNHRPIVSPQFFELCNAALGLAGEASELHDSLVGDVNETDVSDEDIRSELGDVLYYSARVIDFLYHHEYISVPFDTVVADAYASLYAITGTAGHDTLEAYTDTLSQQAGKIAECVKKTVFHGKNLSEDAWMEPLVNVLMNAAGIAFLINTDLENVAEQNLAKLAARYPQGFTPGGGIR